MINLEEILLEYGVVKWAIVNSSSSISYSEYEKWVSENKHAPLEYLSGERAEIREDIRKYYPEFKSALVMLFDYSRASKIAKEFYNSSESNGQKIASYVLGFGGMDYHYKLREVLENIDRNIKEKIPNLNSKFSLDTQPILE